MSESKLIAETSLQLLSEGISLHEVGKASEAIQVLRNALEIDTDNYLAAYLLGICYRDLGNHAAALRFLEQAHKIDPTHAESTQALGLLYVEQGIFDEGVGLLKTYLQSIPGDIITLRALGMAYARQRDYQQALKYLEQAYKAMPHDSALKVEFGLALSRAEQPQRAKEVLRELEGECPSARVLTELAVLTRDVDENPNGALEKLEEAVRLDTHYFRAQRQIGVTHFISGKLVEAIEAFKLASKREPDNILNWRWLAHANMGLGEMDHAQEALLEAAQRNPKVSVLWYELAQLARSSGEISKAQEYIGEATKLTPDQPEVIILSLMIDLDSGQADRAYQEVDRILERNPVLADAVSSLAIRAYHKNDIDVTKRLFELVIEKTESPRAINNLGYLLAGLGEYEAAEVKFKTALKSGFDNPELTYINLGYLKILTGEPVDAEKYLQKARNLIENYQPNYTPILRVAGISEDRQYGLLFEGEISLNMATYGNLATAFAAQGELDKALDAAKESIISDEAPAGYMVLASIYTLLGDSDNVKLVTQKIKELLESKGG